MLEGKVFYSARVTKDTYAKLKALSEKRGSILAETLEEILTEHKRNREEFTISKAVGYIAVTEKSHKMLKDLQEFYQKSDWEIIDFVVEKAENG